MLEVIRNLRLLLTRKDKFRLAGVIVLLFISAMLEVAGLGLLLPVVAVFTKPELLEQNKFLAFFRQLFAGLNDHHFLMICCGAIILLYLVKGLWLFFTMRVYTGFVCKRLAEIACRLYSGFLDSRYRIFSEQGKVELNVRIQKVDAVATMVVLPFMQIVVDTLAIIFIALTLMATIPFVVLGCGLIFGIGSLLLILPVKHLGNQTGKELNWLMGKINKLAYYSLEDVKTIKISGTSGYFSRIFSRLRYKRGQCDSNFYLLGQIPRLVLELLAVISAVAMLLIMLGRGIPVGTVILSFSLLIAAMSRLLPAFSRIHYALNAIRIGAPMLREVVEALQWEKEDVGDTTEPLVFRDELKVENLTFGYPGSSRNILSGLNFTLKRNSSLAIVGPTGGGKSTLVDLLLGFYTPDGGKILVDGKNIYDHLGAWRKLVGFVPQFIVLADTTVAANVAVGVEEEKIDRARVREVLRIAQLEEFIDTLPQGLDTVIGDNGMRLSGGQRQRLGIARALYRDPEVIIFDEATSALDTETEEALINAVETLHGSKTLIMVAHRLSTVEKCDLRVEIRPEETTV